MFAAFFVYPGISLTLMRSFLEHQAKGPKGKSARFGGFRLHIALPIDYLVNNET